MRSIKVCTLVQLLHQQSNATEKVTNLCLIQLDSIYEVFFSFLFFSTQYCFFSLKKKTKQQHQSKPAKINFSSNSLLLYYDRLNLIVDHVT